jgi:hypothetical protein
MFIRDRLEARASCKNTELSSGGWQQPMTVWVGGFVHQQASDSRGEETAMGGWADEQV